MNGKRGISPVVATVALVLITFTAALIIAQYVVPFVKEELRESSECFDYQQDYFTFDEDSSYNCYVDVNGVKKYAVSIHAKTVSQEDAAKVIGLHFVFSSGATSTPVQFFVGSRDPGLGPRFMIGGSTSSPTRADISIPQRGEIRTYGYDTTSINTQPPLYSSVSVHPILSNGRVCDVSDSIALVPCSSTVSIP